MGSKRLQGNWIACHLGHALRGGAPGVSAATARRVGARVLAAVLMSSTSVGTALLAMPHRANAQETRQATFAIPAGTLSSALAAFGRQSGMQVTYAPEIAAGRRSPGMTGTAPLNEAIIQILRGTGLSYVFTGSNTVAISAGATEGAAGAVADDGSILLDTIAVTTAGGAIDRPFETPGSTNFISGEELERFPAQTSGAIFQGTPGVISGGGNNGASIDPNIRGLQGMNRVATTIDGAQQSTSSYRGYSGVDSRTYVDPDLISGITITKGPEGGVAGAIGGTIAMDTLGVEDILGEGEHWGVRVRGGGSTNTVEPVIGATEAVFGGKGSAEFTNGSFAVATREDNVDFVGAFVRRQTGNYVAGTHGSLTTEDYLGKQVPLSNYGHGQLVYNTSEDVTSALLKTTFRPTDEQELQIGYLYYGNDFGEVSPSTITAGNGVTRQLPLSAVEVNQATLRYNYKPTDTELVDFKANAYVSNIDETNVFTVLGGIERLQQQSQNFGANAQNTSRFTVADTPLAISYGGSYIYENGQPTEPYSFSDAALWAIPVDAEREIGSLFARAKWEPTSWLALEAGLEYLAYDTTFNGVTTYDVPGDPFTSYSGDGFSPSASVTVTPLEGWQIYGQYSSGIRPPSGREVSQTRSDQIFNPDLVAEEASNWEVGTNLLRDDLFMPGDKARLKFAYFDNTTNNYIGRQFDGSYMGLFNYDFVRFKGFEFSGRYDTGRVFADFGLNYYTDYEACLQDGSCIDYTLSADYLTNQIPPRFTASLTAGARFLDERLTLGGRVTYMSERLAPVRTSSGYFTWVTKVWEPYTVVDAFAQWKLNDNVTLDVSVQNLLDAYYVDALNNTDMPAPGRTVTATLTGKLGGTERLAPLPFGAPSGSGPWTGLYVGGHFGYGFGAVDGTTTLADGTQGGNAALESADQSFGGGLAGAQIGYNYQFRNDIVLGIEADLSFSGMSDSRRLDATEGPLLVEHGMPEARTDYAFDWLATVRGKAGYAFDRLFVYGTGGLAFLRETERRSQYISTSATAEVPAGHTTELAFTETASNTRSGFTLGAGAEYAINERWSIKADYLYAGFGVENFLFGNARGGVTRTYTTRVQDGCVPLPLPVCIPRYVQVPHPGSSETVNGRRAANEAEFQMVKIGVNYRF